MVYWVHILQRGGYHEFHKKHNELSAYVLWGLITSLVNLVIYFVCASLLHWNYLLSNLTAWVFAALFAFFANKLMVFRSNNWNKGAVFAELGKFMGTRLFSFLCESFLLWLCVSVIGIIHGIAKILVGIVILTMNYIFGKLFIFRGKES